MPSDTQTVLGADASECKSRSLFMDRFANPAARDEERKKWFEVLAATAPAKVERRLIGTGQGVIYAQLQSRLMLNMAGGVMENAGLCLDRFGLPFIPGSAVKGCARRMATCALLESDSAEAKAECLFGLALVFGWGDTDWNAGRKRKRKQGQEVETEPHSDFWWAMAPDTGNRSDDDTCRHTTWRQVAASVATRLLNHLRVSKREHPNEPWRDLPNFAGSVSFLHAWPVDATGAALVLRLPPLGKLELDVLTCHHPEYYRGDRDVATDNEGPNPVAFPAVAAGHVFAFGLLPMRNCTDALLKQARQWLADGLSLFGLGAKTAAGYGWFDVSPQVQEAVAKTLAAREKAVAERKQIEAEAAALKAKGEAERKRREEMKAAMASLTPEQQEDYKLAALSDDQFRSALDNFARKSAEEQKAIVRSLRTEPTASDSRRAFWEDLKAKAQRKGGKYAQTEQALRQLSKQMYPGKDGKMP